MKVIVTANGSPAKYDDWEGVTVIRKAASGSLDDVVMSGNAAIEDISCLV